MDTVHTHKMDEQVQNNILKKPAKKRLAILIWDMGIGGVQKRVKDIVLDISKNHRDWEVHLLIKYNRPSIYVDQIENKKNIFIHWYRYSDSYKKSKSPIALFWILERYLTLKPDSFLTFLDHLSVISVTIKRLVFWQKTKLFLNEGNLTSNFIKIHRRFHFLWNFLIRSTYKYADKMIVPSKACKRDLVENYSVPPRKIVVIPNWTMFPPEKHGPTKYDMIYAGRLEKEKKLFTTIDIVSRLKEKFPGIKMAILGSGSLLEKLQDEISKRNLNKNFVFLGYKRNVASHLKRSKIYLLTSVNEGLPNSVLEAACCQVPTVSYKFPGADEIIINGKTGYVSTSTDIIAKSITVLLKNPKKLSEMGKNAQKFVMKNNHHPNQVKFINTVLA